MSVLDTILKYFTELSQIPRGSGNEKAVREWAMKWAEERGFDCETDSTGNLLIRIPEKGERRGLPSLALQGHLDMVCVRLEDSTHDFEKDPIQLVYEGDWLRSEGTTLGADNGMGIALTLAAVDEAPEHPPLELLFTVGEEVGLIGAIGLSPGFLKSRQLLNFDSNGLPHFVIGCAGGCDVHYTFPAEREATAGKRVTITIRGLRGGHSGCDIHRERGNALILLRRLAALLKQKHRGRLCRLSGGEAKNVIPPAAEGVFLLPVDAIGEAFDSVNDEIMVLKEELVGSEPDMEITITECTDNPGSLTEDCERKLYQLLDLIPHGVLTASPEDRDSVSLSANLAVVEEKDEIISVTGNARNLYVSHRRWMKDRYQSVGEAVGVNVAFSGEYKGWTPTPASGLKNLCESVYREITAEEPSFETIHGGLECGIIGAKHPGMDMISFGFDLRDIHSAKERVFLPSVEKTARFLFALLERMCQG